MESQNSKSSAHGQNHPILSNNFGTNAPSFPTHNFSSAAAAVSGNNVSSPLFMQTLQQLSGLSNAAAGLLPSDVEVNSLPSVSSHFPAADFANWNPQSNWLDQAKMAAMLPVYLKTAVSGSNEQFQSDMSSIVEQNLKNQAAAVAAAVAATGLQTNNGHAFPQYDSMAMHKCQATGSSMGVAQSPLSNSSPSIAHSIHESQLSSRTIHTHTSYPSSSSSHPPSNEGMIESPLSSYSIPYHGPQQMHHQQTQELDPNLNITPYQHTYALQNNQQNKSGFSVSSHMLTNNKFKQVLQNAPSSSILPTFGEMNMNKTSVPVTQGPALKHYNASHLKTSNFSNIDRMQPNQHQLSGQKIGYQQKIDATLPSTSINSDVAENMDDLSTMLDLHEFEDFLNDKDALAAALNSDPATLLNDVVNAGEGIQSSVASSNNANTNVSRSVVDKTPLPNRRINLPIPSTSSITSAKMRERIHERRAEELANADKELDRLVSLVARQNDAKTKTPTKTANLSLLNLDLLGSLKPSSSAKPSLPMPEDSPDVILNPVQFTPPDSPTNNGQPCLISRQSASSSKLPTDLLSAISLLKEAQKHGCENTNGKFTLPTQPKHHHMEKNPAVTVGSAPKNIPDSTNKETKITPEITQPLVFIPKVDPCTSSSSTICKSAHNSTKKNEKSSIKFNRIPIYKQRSQNLSFSSRILNQPVEKIKFAQSENAAAKDDLKSTSDAYNFTDDEDAEEESAIPKSATALNPINNTSCKTLKFSKNMDNSVSNAADMSHGRRRRNYGNIDGDNHFLSVAPAGASARVEIVSSSHSGQLLDKLRQRREECSDYIKSVEVQDADNSFMPDIDEKCKIRRRSTMTCMIKTQSPMTTTAEEQVVLPKLVIKFVKSEPLECDTSDKDQLVKLKKKKKHKRRDRDYDWDESLNDSENSKCKRLKDERHHHHHHTSEKKHKRRHSLNLNESATEKSIYAIPTRHMSIDQSPLIKRKKDSSADGIVKCTAGLPLSSDSNLTENHTEHRAETIHSADETQCHSALDKLDQEFINTRLECLSRANGMLPKGTFLVAKDDAFKEGCPLWKIDNQNLLQKYPRVKGTESSSIFRYRNSSTYSGWCDRIADDYMVIEVKFVKQSRAENIIEPLAPIHDLFPVVVSDMRGNILAIRTDMNYLESLNDIECRVANTQKIHLRRAKWTEIFLKSLNTYCNLSYGELEYSSKSLCQACNTHISSAYIYLFGYYEEPSLLENEERTMSEYHDHCIGFSVCGSCENLAVLYHRNTHFKLHLFRKCAEKLEEVALESSHINDSNEIIESCIQDRKWVQTLINEHSDLWEGCNDLTPQASLPYAKNV